MVFLGFPLDLILLFHDPDEEGYLPANAIAAATPGKEICRRGDHEGGVRRTAYEFAPRCEYEIGMSDSALPCPPTAASAGDFQLQSSPLTTGIVRALSLASEFRCFPAVASSMPVIRTSGG